MLNRIAFFVLASILIGHDIALSQATAPATDQALAEGALKITITGAEGIVQARTAPGQPWQKVTPGMELAEGAELRTGPKSAVRFVIPPDQTITLDRLGTVQILRANFENGKLVTDLGMKYGRTRYDIEAAGREHDAKVRSPNSVLAVRGTRVSLYDQPPFTPQAVSLTGRAFFRDAKKQTSFGGRGKSRITTEQESSAQAALSETNVDPRTGFGGRTANENEFGLTLGSFSGPEYKDFTLFALATQFNAVIGTIPVTRELAFNIDWNGSAFSNVDLTVTNPGGLVLSRLNPNIPGAGQFITDAASTADVEGQNGRQAIVWTPAYVSGNYTVRVDLRTTGPNDFANVNIVGIDDPLKQGTPIGFVQQTLSPTSPSFTTTMTAPAPPRPASRSRNRGK